MVAELLGWRDGEELLALAERFGEVGGVVHGLQLNRYVRIPAPTPRMAAPLHARVTTVVAQNTWRYTLHNDEAPDSGLYVSSLALMVSAPVMITGTPPDNAATRL